LDADHTTIAAEALLTELVYELLDAHGDTVMLAGEPLDGVEWHAHLEYLRGLQRVGRETLARLAV
jgi:hypothetical protein